MRQELRHRLSLSADRKSSGAFDAAAHDAQDCEAGRFRQVQIDDDQIRAIYGVRFKSVDETDRGIAVGNDDQFARNAVLVKRRPYQPRVRPAVLHQNDREGLHVRARSLKIGHGGA